MKKITGLCFRKLLFLPMAFILATGCSTSKSAGIHMATSDIETIETIAEKQDTLNLSDYEGVALLSLAKGGVSGFGITGWSASVFVKDPVKNIFGPPSFVSVSGLSVGVGYAGLNIVDCLLLFKNRDDAVKFASRETHFNFSNEASLLIWGRKQMTVPGALSASDGAGLCVGFVELELLFGGPRGSLHKNMYQEEATVEKILLGDVAIPEEIKGGLEKLNLLMKHDLKTVSAPVVKPVAVKNPSVAENDPSDAVKSQSVAVQPPPVVVGDDTLVNKLKLLKSTREANLLTEQEYQQKRAELLKGL
jgi:lipid-binding SYLF domain-containing protein